jgi:flagellar biosynthesis/type III secretory pathway protein FliH
LGPYLYEPSPLKKKKRGEKKEEEEEEEEEEEQEQEEQEQEEQEQEEQEQEEQEQEEKERTRKPGDFQFFFTGRDTFNILIYSTGKKRQKFIS